MADRSGGAQIRCGPFNDGGVVSEHTERSVAVVAEQPANAAGRMVVVNRHKASDAFVDNTLRRVADSAAMALPLKQRVVLLPVRSRRQE